MVTYRQFKAQKIQNEALKLQQQKEREDKEKEKYLNELNQRAKRNKKLKAQLEKWEKEKVIWMFIPMIFKISITCCHNFKYLIKFDNLYIS